MKYKGRLMAGSHAKLIPLPNRYSAELFRTVTEDSHLLQLR